MADPSTTSGSEGSDSEYENGSAMSQSTTETSASSASVCGHRGDELLKPLSFPASVEDPERQYPPLPELFPQIPLNATPTVTAEPDLQTPDKWIKRNPELLRLTGKHPLNCEAPLKRLFDIGFFTPSHLHFVRNHGAVPQVDEEKLRNWRIRIHGLIEHECEFSLNDLKEKFQVVSLPVTLVCAGNRRKEQNVVRKSLGFSWGAAGVSTAVWTGVYLADVLDYVKPLRPKAKHVIFEGSDNLPKGPYGTSQKLSWAMNKDKGMMIAWAMNGLPLEPDHGFPVRMLIPGQIGGRSVKWLNSVEVSEKESQHYLHFFDNKVLPTQLSPEQARAEPHWWYDPKYLITELNVNSAIAHPDHNDVLEVDPSIPEEQSAIYTVRGYAYAGGGRRINRVELSFDDGASWTLAEVEYPEDKFREMSHADQFYGTFDLTMRDTCFCWCFWSFPISVTRLAAASSIAVRAMDEGMNTQPRDMYLNPTSMLHNWWFRVAILKTENGIRFEHPTLATEPGGWMERMKAAGQDIMRPVFESEQKPEPILSLSSADPPAEISLVNPEVKRHITMAELKSQPKDRPWFVVKGEVYDGTAYLQDHPGGADSIIMVAGDDATEDFMSIHSIDAKIKLREYHIGTLADGASAQEASTSDPSTSAFLQPKIWKPVKLTTITRVNHDSCLFHFSLTDPQQPLGLPTGQHVWIRLKRKDTGETVQRAYTPVSDQKTVGGIDFLIKLYLPCPAFPVGGKMSVGLSLLEVGDSVELKGPVGSFIWKGSGRALWRDVERFPKQIGMICGGSGITPILQVLRAILHDADDRDTRIWLLNANKTEADILCKEELHQLLDTHGPSRIRLHYTLSLTPENWGYSKGRINDEMLSSHLPPPSRDGLILVCGPNPMISETIKPGLQRCGWDIQKSLVVF